MLLGAAILQYLDDRRPDWSRQTHRVRRITLNVLLRDVGDIELERIDELALARWVRARGGGAETQRANVSTVRGLFGWATDAGLIVRDPTVRLRRPKVPEQIPRALSAEAVAALFSVLPDATARAAVSLMVQEALRCCEVSAATEADYDRSRGTLLVHGKGSKDRLIPVTDRTAERLAAVTGRWLIGARLSPHTLSLSVAQWLYEAGVKRHSWDRVGAHSLRHTAAQDVFERCGDVLVVQQLLGHSNLATTQRYLRQVGIDRLRVAMEGRRYA